MKESHFAQNPNWVNDRAESHEGIDNFDETSLGKLAKKKIKVEKIWKKGKIGKIEYLLKFHCIVRSLYMYLCYGYCTEENKALAIHV